MSEHELHRVLRQWIWGWLEEHAPTTMTELHAAALENFAANNYFVAWLASADPSLPFEEAKEALREPLHQAVEDEAQAVFNAAGSTLAREDDRIVRRPPAE